MNLSTIVATRPHSCSEILQCRKRIGFSEAGHPPGRGNNGGLPVAGTLLTGRQVDTGAHHLDTASGCRITCKLDELYPSVPCKARTGCHRNLLRAGGLRKQNTRDNDGHHEHQDSCPDVGDRGQQRDAVCFDLRAHFPQCSPQKFLAKAPEFV